MVFDLSPEEQLIVAELTAAMERLEYERGEAIAIKPDKNSDVIVTISKEKWSGKRK